MRLNEPAVEPPGECRSNLDVFHALAERMGFTENCLYDTGETIIRDLLATDSPYLHGISIARLRAEPAVRLNLPDRPHVPYADGVFPTPSGKIELFSASLAAVGAEPLPTWRPETESAEASPELFGRYPLKLITPKEQHFLGSSFANLDSFQRMARRPTLDIAPDDAKVRAIMSGDQVEVFNQRGWCRLTARVADTLLPGVVVSEVVPWQKLSEGGRNVNWTTPDYVTDIGANSAYHTNLVEVRRVDPPGTDRDSRRSDPLARRQ
jgi:anaerobic selenocysteine-containing dehydrogenase